MEEMDLVIVGAGMLSDKFNELHLFPLLQRLLLLIGERSTCNVQVSQTSLSFHNWALSKPAFSSTSQSYKVPGAHIR